MGYAINTDGGWRLVNDSADIMSGEQYSEFPIPSRPSPYHVFTGTVSTDPLACWRPLTQAEIDALKAALASSVANGIELQDVVKAAFLVVLDGINTLRAQHSLAAITPAQFKQAIINKLPNP